MEGEKYLSSEDRDTHQTAKVQLDVRDQEIPVRGHLQIVAQQIQATLRQSVSLRELAATSYLRGRMDFIIALAMANLCKLQHSAGFLNLVVSSAANIHTSPQTARQLEAAKEV